MEIRVTHALDPSEAAARLAAAARENDIELAPEPGSKGRVGALSKVTPLGAIAGTFRVEADAVVVTIEKRPAFLPEATVRRLLEDNLGSVMAG